MVTFTINIPPNVSIYIPAPWILWVYIYNYIYYIILACVIPIITHMTSNGHTIWYPLVNCHILPWKDPPNFSWENPRTFNGHLYHSSWSSRVYPFDPGLSSQLAQLRRTAAGRQSGCQRRGGLHRCTWGRWKNMGKTGDSNSRVIELRIDLGKNLLRFLRIQKLL